MRTSALFILISTLSALVIGHAVSSQRAAGNKRNKNEPTFYRDVLPILQQHCQACHRARGIAPMTFETFQLTRTYADAIRVSTENRTMPPWFAEKGIGKFSNDPSLNETEMATLAAWADAKAPQGDIADPPIFGETVHHSLTSPEDRRGAMWTDSDILLVYAPGSNPDNWPDSMAKFVPAGSDLVFQMHYTTNAKSGTDVTRVGLICAKQPPKQRVLTLQLTNDHFVIPPGVPDYRVEARGTLPNDALLLSFFPHMHLRGKRFEYNIVHADRNIETLLRVNYHFHWQMSYRLAQPLPLKAGTELQSVAWFDNSKQNVHNTDPGAAVRWGEQTTDEMMVGFFDVAVAPQFDKHRFFQRDGVQR